MSSCYSSPCGWPLSRHSAAPTDHRVSALTHSRGAQCRCATLQRAFAAAFFRSTALDAHAQPSVINQNLWFSFAVAPCSMSHHLVPSNKVVPAGLDSLPSALSDSQSSPEFPQNITSSSVNSEKLSLPEVHSDTSGNGTAAHTLEVGDAEESMRLLARQEMGKKAATPCNFHQAAVFFNLNHSGSSKKVMSTMLVLSCLLIWMQLLSVLAFVYGVYNSTCSRSSDCFVGQFCAPSSGGVKAAMMCHPCLREWDALCSKDGSVLEPTTAAPTLWQKSIWPEEAMNSDSLQKMCLACMVEFSFLPGRDAARGNVAKMSAADVFIFVLCLGLISLSVINELRDIFLCAFARLGDPALSAAAEQRKANGLAPIPRAILSLVPHASSTWKLHWLLFVHQCIRHYAVLPVLIMAIPMLVVVQGSSGVSICLNSVGVLFVLEMDNLAYQYGIPEQDRELMEANGTLHLSDRDNESLVRMKNAHLISVPAGIVVTLLLINSDVTGPYHMQIVWMLVCSLSFWACGLVNSLIQSKDDAPEMQLKLFIFEASQMVLGEGAIWCALCLLYPYFIPRFFSGAFW